MRHQSALRKLNRNPAHRRALLRNMLASLIKHERFQTTYPRAKELQRVADKFITLAKEDSLHARRQALAFIPDKNAVHKLVRKLAPRYRHRSGGYSRVVRCGYRHGDAAQLAVIELLPEELQS